MFPDNRDGIQKHLQDSIVLGWHGIHPNCPGKQCNGSVEPSKHYYATKSSGKYLMWKYGGRVVGDLDDEEICDVALR